MALRKSKFPAGATVEAIESHHVQVDGEAPRFILEGSRLRADDAAVQLNPSLFAVAGSPHAEIDAQRRDLYAVERQPEPPIVRTKIERRLRDEDAVVAKWGVGGVPAGAKVDRKDPIVKQQPDGFVEVAGKGLTRADSYKLLATLQHTDHRGVTRIAYKGTWIGKNDPLVALHPLNVGLLEPEELVEADAA
jgi:hypothetical protein